MPIKSSLLSNTEQLSFHGNTGIYGGIAELSGERLMALSPGRRRVMRAVYSRDRGIRFSNPQLLRDRRGRPIPGGYDAVGLLKLISGKLLITYARRHFQGQMLRTRELLARTSNDEGKTWSAEIEINRPGETAANYHDTITQLSSGRLILPVRWCFKGAALAANHTVNRKIGAYGRVLGKSIKIESHAHYPEMELAYVYYSDDEGKKWSVSTDHIMIWEKGGAIFPADEPSIAQRSDGSLLMLLRTTVGRIYQSISQDEGLNWSLPEPTPLASSYSPARLRRIPGTNDLVCIWNNVGAAEIRAGFRRSRLSIAISSNGGRNWHAIKNLACAGLPDRTKINPPKQITPVRARPNVGVLPKDFGVAHYPNIRFIGDQAFILWLHGEFHKDKTGTPKCVQERVLKIVPISWLYTQKNSERKRV